MSKSNLVQLIPRNAAFSEDMILASNLQQILDAIVLKHGANIVMTNLPSMVQDAQAKARQAKRPQKVKKAGSQ